MSDKWEDGIFPGGDPQAIDTISALRAEVARLQAELDAARERERWIPIRERWPANEDKYLFGWWDQGLFLVDQEYYIPGKPGIWKGYTHWCPLPAAPEVEK